MLTNIGVNRQRKTGYPGDGKVQSLAKKLVVSVSKIRKLAVFFLFVEIKKLMLYMVWKT